MNITELSQLQLTGVKWFGQSPYQWWQNKELTWGLSCSSLLIRQLYRPVQNERAPSLTPSLPLSPMPSPIPSDPSSPQPRALSTPRLCSKLQHPFRVLCPIFIFSTCSKSTPTPPLSFPSNLSKQELYPPWLLFPPLVYSSDWCSTVCMHPSIMGPDGSRKQIQSLSSDLCHAQGVMDSSVPFTAPTPEMINVAPQLWHLEPRRLMDWWLVSTASLCSH